MYNTLQASDELKFELPLLRYPLLLINHKVPWIWSPRIAFRSVLLNICSITATSLPFLTQASTTDLITVLLASQPPCYHAAISLRMTKVIISLKSLKSFGLPNCTAVKFKPSLAGKAFLSQPDLSLQCWPHLLPSHFPTAGWSCPTTTFCPSYTCYVISYVQG